MLTLPALPVAGPPRGGLSPKEGRERAGKKGLPLPVRAQQGFVAAAPALRAPLLRPARSGRRLGSPRRRSQ